MNRANWMWMRASVAVMRAAAAAMKDDARKPESGKLPALPLIA